MQFAGSYIIVLVVFAAAAWYGLMRGIGVVTAATIALPLTLLLYEAGLGARFLDTLFLQGLQHPPTGIAIFLVLTVSLYVAVRHVSANTSSGASGILRALTASIALIAMFLAVWHAFAPTRALWHFGTEFDVLFRAEFFFWWLLGALFVTYISGFAGYAQKRFGAASTQQQDKYAAGVRYD